MQIVAHELFHCFQFWELDVSNLGEKRWWLEGSAEYFSNVVVPDGDLEHRAIEHFNSNSNVFSLFDMSNENFAFFQHLANQIGDQAVIDLLEAVSPLDRAAAEAHMSNLPNMQGLYHNLFVTFLSTGIPDPGGTPIRTDMLRVRENQSIEDVESFSFSANPFIGVRIGLQYGKEKRFIQSGELIGDGLYSAVLRELRTDPTAWSMIPEEIRTSCTAGSSYILLLTSVIEPIKLDLTVSQVEKASCDACLLGSWIVDHGSFAEYMNNLPDMQSGAAIEWAFSGDYYLTFGENGLLSSLRNDFTSDLTSTSGGQTFNFRTVINASSAGNYSADGEVLMVWNLVEVIDNLTGYSDGVVISLGTQTSSVSFFGAQSPLPFDESVGANDVEDTQAGYSCSLNDLEITTTYGTVRWERVEEIPPTAIPTPVEGATEAP
jgi:hypothetical protein